MAEEKSKSWKFNRQVNLSVLIQLVLLASLIISSWVNLQRQLDLLQHDVTILVEDSRQFQQKLESLSTQAIEHEYRIKAVEKAVAQTN
jgi:septal ring factor EnvC (AmiA/AmiB activator)